VHAGTTRDLSLKGLLMLCSVTVPQQACAVVIYLDGRGGHLRIRATGKVARAQGGTIAVEFHELIDPDSYQHLTNLVRYNARDMNRVDREINTHLGLKKV
jgi:hypothetical protein